MPFWSDGIIPSPTFSKQNMHSDQPKRQACNTESKSHNPKPNLSIALALLCGGLFACFVAGGCTTSRQHTDFQLLAQALTTIQEHYVDRAAVQPQELTYGAISGMVD